MYFAEELQSERERRKKVEERQRRTLTIVRLLAVGAFFLLLLSLLLEGYRVSPLIERGFALARESKVERKTPGQLEEAPTLNLAELFASELTGYVVKARQVLPESAGREAEAIYEPMDMNLQLKAPTTIYVKLTYFASEEAAQKYVAEKLREYPLNQGTRLIEGETAYTGYSSDRNKFGVLVRLGNYVFWFQSMFTVSDPVEKGSYLEDHGLAVVRGVIKHFKEVKGVNGNG